MDGEMIVLVEGGSDGIRDIHDVLCSGFQWCEGFAYTAHVVSGRSFSVMLHPCRDAGSLGVSARVLWSQWSVLSGCLKSDEGRAAQ